MARPKVVHIKSNTLNKKPTTGQIDYGEIAVNYNSGNTFLAVKDSKNDIKVFTDKTTNDASYAPKSDFNELKQGVIDNEQTTSAALNDLNTRVNQLSSVDMGNYATTATTEAIKSDISGLTTSVESNETKISALEANLRSYVPTSRTINGTALTSNITITKVESATTSTNVNGHTVAKSVPSNAVFTDTTYDDVTTSTHGLMTAADKTKLDGIASGATKYSHPTFTAKTSGFYKIAVNNEGHVTGTTNVEKSDITGLIGGTPSLTGHNHDDRYYTEAEVNTKLATKSNTGHTHDDRYYTESEVNTKLATKSNTGHTHRKSEITDLATWARADTKPSYNFSEIDGSVDVTRQLSGKIPEANLPSYVDDVLEYNSKSNFPKSGETGKIYVDKSTNLTYRWGGSAYVEISPSLALGETSGTAYRGDYGAIAYAHSQKRSGNPHGVTKSDIGLGNVENKSSADIRNDITKANVTTALGYTPANQTDLSSYVTSTELNNKEYVTQSDLNTLSSQIPTTYAGSSSAGGPANSALKVRDSGNTEFTINIGYQGNSLKADEIKYIAAYARKGGEILIKDAPASAVISYLSAVTQTELEGKGYVTSTELNSKGYITAVTVSNHYSPSTRNYYLRARSRGEVDVRTPLTDISVDSKGHIVGGYYTSEEVAFLSDLSNYVTSGELENKGYITSSELDGKGYVTSSELNSKGYITAVTVSNHYSPSTRNYYLRARSRGEVDVRTPLTDISVDSKGHIVGGYYTSEEVAFLSDLSNYVTSGELENKGYITSSELDGKGYVTSSELYSKGYVYRTGDTMSGTLYIDNSNSIALTCTGKTEFEGDVTVTGKVSASSGFFETSDRRLKNFQGDIEVDFDKLKSIPKKYFYWNMDSKKSKLEIGTSAQEVMEVYPELVSINEAGMLSVAYDKLSVIALKAVDELHEENVALKEKNDELERRLKAIEEKLGI